MNDTIYRQAAINAIENTDCELPPNAWDELTDAIMRVPSAPPDNSCDGCKYENADDGVLVPCGFCKRSHPDNYERRTYEHND